MDARLECELASTSKMKQAQSALCAPAPSAAHTHRANASRRMPHTRIHAAASLRLEPLCAAHLGLMPSHSCASQNPRQPPVHDARFLLLLSVRGEFVNNRIQAQVQKSRVALAGCDGRGGETSISRVRAGLCCHNCVHLCAAARRAASARYRGAVSCAARHEG